MREILFLTIFLFSCVSNAAQILTAEEIKIYSAHDKNFPYSDATLSWLTHPESHQQYRDEKHILESTIHESYLEITDEQITLHINGYALPVDKEPNAKISSLRLFGSDMNTAIYYAGSKIGFDLLFCSDYCNVLYLASYITNNTQTPEQINLQSGYKTNIARNKEIAETRFATIGDLLKPSEATASKESCNIVPGIYINKIEDSCSHGDPENKVIYTDASSRLKIHFSHTNNGKSHIEKKHADYLLHYNRIVENIKGNRFAYDTKAIQEFELPTGKLLAAVKLEDPDTQEFTYLSNISLIGDYYYFSYFERNPKDSFEQDINLLKSLSDTPKKNQYEWMTRFKEERDPTFEQLFAPGDVEELVNNIFTEKGNYLLTSTYDFGTTLKNLPDTDRFYQFSPACSFYPKKIESVVFRYYISDQPYHFKEEYDQVVILQMSNKDHFFYRKQKGESVVLCDLRSTSQNAIDVAALLDKFLEKKTFPNADNDELISNIFDHIFESFNNSKGEKFMIVRPLGKTIVFDDQGKQAIEEDYDYMSIYNTVILTGNMETNGANYGLISFELETLLEAKYKNIEALGALNFYEKNKDAPEFSTFKVTSFDGKEQYYSAKYKRLFDSVCDIQSLENVVINTAYHPEVYCPPSPSTEDELLDELGL